MAELKTKLTDASVAKFIKTVEDADRRADCEKIIALMKKVTKAEPKMWGRRSSGLVRSASSTIPGESLIG